MQANLYLAARLLAGLLGVSSVGCNRHEPSVATREAAEEVSYRATGTEPFWGVSITPQALRVTWPEPEPSVTTPYTVEEVDGSRVYRSPTLTLTVTSKRCTDGMSERVYPDTVELKIAERVLRGCGWPSSYDLGPPP